MKRKVLILIISLVCLSLAGIIGVQFFWIRNAIRLKTEQFNRSVNDALVQTVSQLETRENIKYIRRNYEGDSILSFAQTYSRDTLDPGSMKERLDSLLSGENEAIPPPPKPKPVSRPRQPRVVRYSYTWDPSTGMMKVDSSFVEQRPNSLSEPEQFSFPDFSNNFQFLDIDSILQYNFSMSVDPEWSLMPEPPPVPRPPADDIQRLANKARKLQNIIKKLTFEIESHPQPLQQRINKKGLENILRKSLADKGVDIPFEFAVLSPYSNTRPIPIQSAGFTRESLSTTHRISLFPNDIFQKPDYLLLFFPNQQQHLLKSVSWLMIASVLFTLVVIIATGLSIFAMIRQKRISDIKTDFINNMTHEFKTPIATISIAADSIGNPKVIEDPDMIRNYTRVIKEENSRMNTRVEQVLQMALLDSSEFRLNLVPVDIHEIIRKTAGNIGLQVERREGQLVTELSAVHSTILGDETHLSNMFMNLLDNAIKYSSNKPEIKVCTSNNGNFIVIQIMDKGIGMSREEQKKIFDKFYRVSSGNIHTIKGFGLGLSYSKAIILAHHGTLSVTSEPGKGSTFEVSIPLNEG